MTQKQLPPQSRGHQNKPSDFKMCGGYGSTCDKGNRCFGRHGTSLGGRDKEEDSSPDGQEKEQATGTQWPWGPAGRPSDQDAGQQRPNEPAGEPPRKRSCLPTDKPNEPAGEPPGRPLRLASTSEGEPQTAEGKSKVTLVPNLRWQVQRVQEHMARQRGSTTRSRSETQ